MKKTPHKQVAIISGRRPRSTFGFSKLFWSVVLVVTCPFESLFNRVSEYLQIGRISLRDLLFIRKVLCKVIRIFWLTIETLNKGQSAFVKKMNQTKESSEFSYFLFYLMVSNKYTTEVDSVTEFLSPYLESQSSFRSAQVKFSQFSN